MWTLKGTFWVYQFSIVLSVLTCIYCRCTCHVGVLCVCVCGLCVCLCAYAPFQLSQETRWSGQFKLELLKGPWHRCHKVRVFSRLIRSCSTFWTLVFRLPYLPTPSRPTGSTCLSTEQAARYPSHNHFKSGQHSFAAWPAVSCNLCLSKAA